jgi:DNA-binding MarR family transcriptional regulator
MKLLRAEKRHHLATHDYAQLATFRGAIRAFLHFSEQAAAQQGLTTQHYQAMLILRGAPDGVPVTINDMARQLIIKHNSAVGLIDRLEMEGLVSRERCLADRRKVELCLTTHGRSVLAKLAATHRGELRRIAPLMEQFFGKLAFTLFFVLASFPMPSWITDGRV